MFLLCLRVWFLHAISFLRITCSTEEKMRIWKTLFLFTTNNTYKYPWGNISQKIAILPPCFHVLKQQTLYSSIEYNTILIYAMSITVCFVTKGFKSFFSGKLFTLLSYHPLILFTRSYRTKQRRTIKYKIFIVLYSWFILNYGKVLKMKEKYLEQFISRIICDMYLIWFYFCLMV